MHPHNKNEDIILAPVKRVAKADYVLWAILVGLIGLGAYAYVRQVIFGLGVTGMNRPIYWGVYITNFVFFIGLAHSGTFISAILRLAGAEFRRPLARSAEAITLFSLPFGAISVVIDMGRPERVLNLIFYGRYQSPLLWDVTAISLYLFSSVIFMYLALLPDIALCRDRLKDVPAWQQRMYKILALGWEGHPEQFHRLEKVLDGMAIFLTMLVVTVHTVVSWIFGMTTQPGWHTALIGPFFLLGAIFSGTGGVVIVLAILRRVYNLQEVLTVSLFNSLRKLLIVFTLAWFYMMVAEHLTISYGDHPEEMRVLLQRFTGEFSLMFWIMAALVFFLPLLIFIFKAKNSIGWMVVASVMIDVGMWLERYIVIVPTESRPRVLSELAGGIYNPTWIEIAITITMFAGMFLLYAVFTRLFPIIPVWETADEPVAEEAPAPPAIAPVPPA